MVKEYNYISVKEILSRVMRHPLLTDLSMESAIQYTIDFIGIMGLPSVYEDKVENVEIKNSRGKLPCDLIVVNSVRDLSNDMFIQPLSSVYTPEYHIHGYKIQGSVIFTTFKDGDLEISYKAIHTDDDGLPMIPDNPVFLKALELYIKKEWFTILFDLGKLNPAVLHNTQQEYAFRAGQCNNEFVIPSMGEMENITNMLNQLIPRRKEFSNGFSNLGI